MNGFGPPEPPAHQIGPFLSQLVACGWLGRAEAVAALITAMSPPRVSACLRRTRIRAPLAARPSQPSPGQPTDRARAASAARKALQPLLATRAHRRALTAAARHAAGSILSPDEIAALTAETIARHLRASRSATPAGHLSSQQDQP